jgi:hypothetical protein
MGALLASVASVGESVHRFSCRVLAYRESIPSGLSGAFVALVGEGRSLQVGLLSDPLGWQSLEALVLEAAPPFSESHVASALVNLIARALQAGVPDAAALTLGLPLFVDGGVLVGNDTAVQAADIVLGNTRALLVLLERKRP